MEGKPGSPDVTGTLPTEPESEPPTWDRSPLSAGAEGLRVGTCVGRYTLTRFLGRGGMGQVFVARDPQLGREVAVKVLLPGAGGSSVGASARLLREAQALAKLSHPNVVRIYDVGNLGEQVFLAMELLEGKTFGAWLRAARRPWRQVRDVLVAAGRGLAAAHRAGIVHRDFKPENVFVGASGVRVLDFGLARASHDSDDGPGTDAPSGEVELTATGTLLGTPAYMSPEQLFGSRANAASDQFSFCVVLAEALYGERPFPGRTPAQIREAIVRGRPILGPGGGVPRWLAALVLRGLALAPAERHPSMEALLAQLARDPGRRVRNLAMGALAAATLAAGGFVAASVSQRAPDPCVPDPTLLAGVWDPPRRQALRAAFVATELPAAGDVFERTAARLDAYGESLASSYTRACTARRTEAFLDDSRACLDGLRTSLAAFVAELTARIDASGLAEATGTVGVLGLPDACLDIQALATQAPPHDPAVRARVDVLRPRLVELHTRAVLGQARGALAEMEALLPEIRALPYPPLRAGALYAQAQILFLNGRYGDVRAPLEEAIGAGGEARDEPAVARAWLLLLGALDAQEKIDEVLHLSVAASAAIRRAGSPANLRAELAHLQASAQLGKANFALAEDLERQAIALWREAPDADAWSLPKAHVALGSIAKARGDMRAALEAHEQSLAASVAALGAGSFLTGVAHSNVGAHLTASGDLEGGFTHHRAAQEIFERTLPPDHPALASNLLALGRNQERRERMADAEESYRRALKLVERNEAARPLLASALEHLGLVLGSRGDFASSRAQLGRALALRTELHGGDSVIVADGMVYLGDVEDAAGRPAEAAAHYARALAIIEAKAGGESPLTFRALVGLGGAQVALRQKAKARATLGRAERLRAQIVDPQQLSMLDDALAALRR